MNVDEYNCVENIGIDDWAFRKGVTYGSIIINLDTGQAIDLLGNRNQDSFEAWLENHQKVSLVSRDRSTEYSAAISSSGMNITEVADRFHLIKNMSDCITKVISENYADYRGLIRAGENQPAKEVPVRKEAPVRVDSRQVMFDEVKELQGKGFKIAKIAKQLRIQ
jgi:transposase